ncbi:MAG: hypothetical protein ACKODG_04225 [Betaproteobacteria bacterium]
MSQLLPEQPESAASPDTRAIYAELRRLCGVPMVPLIYRHLATIPGGLEWAWSLLGPALRTGRLQESAWIISRSVQLEPAVKLPAEALQILGVTTADLAEFHKLLATYNRSNPVNLLGLRCLALFAERDPQPQVDRLPKIDRVTPWQAPEPVRDLLPMVDPATIQGDARALMVLLNDRGDASRASPIWPSLYRHFASRPPLLALSALVVPPAFRAIDEAADAVQREAGKRAETLIDEIDVAQGVPSPSGEQRQAIIRAINLFTERLPELIAIGALLERSFPNSTQCTSST